jgi:hypothetical protein
VTAKLLFFTTNVVRGQGGVEDCEAKWTGECVGGMQKVPGEFGSTAQAAYSLLYLALRNI